MDRTYVPIAIKKLRDISHEVAKANIPTLNLVEQKILEAIALLRRYYDNK